MNICQVSSFLSISVLTLATSLISTSPALSEKATFFCGTDKDGSPATVVKSAQHGDVPIISWNSGYFAGAGYDNQTRCKIVSQKFQTFSDQGTLKFFTHGKANKQPVICAVASQNSPCNSDSQLFTLKDESNPQETLQKLFDVRSGVSNAPLYENSNSNQQRIYVNYEEFLEKKANEDVNVSQESSSVRQKTPETSDNNLF